MAALTAATVLRNADLSITYQFTSVADGDTFTVGTNKTKVIPTVRGNPTTQASAGTAYAYNRTTGVVTLYPGEDSLGADLTVFPINS